MKFLFVDHYYPDFLKSYYLAHPPSTKLSYHQELTLLLSQHFGTSDLYSHAMRALGHKAIDVVVNDINGQEQWAKEHGVPSLPILTSLINKLWEKFSYLAARKASPREQFILAAQIKAYRPDVLYIHNTSYLSNSFLASIKKEVRLIVGQIAAPMPPLHSFFGFDLIITSLPHFVKIFKEMGISAEYLPLSFDPRILLPAQPKGRRPNTIVR